MGMFDNLLSGMPVVGGLFDKSEKNAKKMLDENKRLYEGIKLPDLAWENFAPEDFQSAGELTPEDASYETISEDPLTRSAQMAALSKMAGLSETGLSEVDELGFNRAKALGARESRAGTQAALSNAQSRGVGGSGLEFAMREMANQGGADRSQDAALEQAAKAAEQRALYTQAYGNQLSGLRDQDSRTATNNAEIINRFNQANTAARNNAQKYNLDNRQSIMNQNTTGRNEAQQFNQEGRRDMSQTGFNNQISRASGVAGANNQQAGYYMDQNSKRAAQRKATGQAIGTAVGTMFGGPAGGQAGGAIGGASGNMFG